METYARDFQDVFVYLISNKKQNGTYVEIGANDPIVGNNTYLLEKNLFWTGISIEIVQSMCTLFQQKRKNNIICGDATKLDYRKIFEEANLPKEIDYLQVDCEPALSTFISLKQIPLDTYKFSIITFEHDFYNYKPNDENYSVKQQSREYLSNFGYVMIADNMSCKNHINKPFEDWWIHPDLIDADMIKRFIATNGINKEVGSYISKRFF